MKRRRYFVNAYLVGSSVAQFTVGATSVRSAVNAALEALEHGDDRMDKRVSGGSELSFLVRLARETDGPAPHIEPPPSRTAAEKE